MPIARRLRYLLVILSYPSWILPKGFFRSGVGCPDSAFPTVDKKLNVLLVQCPSSYLSNESYLHDLWHPVYKFIHYLQSGLWSKERFFIPNQNGSMYSSHIIYIFLQYVIVVLLFMRWSCYCILYRGYQVWLLDLFPQPPCVGSNLRCSTCLALYFVGNRGGC